MVFVGIVVPGGKGTQPTPLVSWLQDLTCMVYHYETQPVPNPLSWYLHHMPADFHSRTRVRRDVCDVCVMCV